MLHEQNAYRIGIIGTGRIAHRFVPEARCIRDVCVQSVYNPHWESAVRFADKWELQACKTLEAFLKDIYIVYIATPHETHYTYALAALEEGRHVLCEKPLALQREQAKHLYDYARQHQLVLMEGIKTCYFPCFHEILRVVRSGRIGRVCNVEACFTKLENPQKRELVDTKYGGSFRELGSYVIMPILKFFGTAPVDLRFESIDDDRGIDLFTKTSLRYREGVATATCGLGVKSDGRLLVSGTKGYIVVPAPWWLTSQFEIHYEDPHQIDRYEKPFLGDGLRYELTELLQRIDHPGEPQTTGLAEKESIALAGMMEAFGRAHSEDFAEEVKKQGGA